MEIKIRNSRLGFMHPMIRHDHHPRNKNNKRLDRALQRYYSHDEIRIEMKLRRSRLGFMHQKQCHSRLSKPPELKSQTRRRVHFNESADVQYIGATPTYTPFSFV